jgi:hypothetical protein
MNQNAVHLKPAVAMVIVLLGLVNVTTLGLVLHVMQSNVPITAVVMVTALQVGKSGGHISFNLCVPQLC